MKLSLLLICCLVGVSAVWAQVEEKEEAIQPYYDCRAWKQQIFQIQNCYTLWTPIYRTGCSGRCHSSVNVNWDILEQKPGADDDLYLDALTTDRECDCCKPLYPQSNLALVACLSYDCKCDGLKKCACPPTLFYKTVRFIMFERCDCQPCNEFQDGEGLVPEPPVEVPEQEDKKAEGGGGGGGKKNP